MRKAFAVFGLFLAINPTACTREEDAPAADKVMGATDHARSKQMEWKRELLRAHEAADRADSPATQAEAARLMEKAFAISASSPRAFVLRQELAARGAAIWVELGRTTAAQELIQRGLDLSAQPSAARAQLLIVRADLAEARGNAEAARVALMAALAINQQLFEQEMKEP